MHDLKFQYMPLTFIKSSAEFKNQIRNTIIMRLVFDKYKKVELLGNLIKKTQYGYTASAKVKGNCKLLRITDIKEFGIEWSSVPYCDCPALDKYRILENDILIARTGGRRTRFHGTFRHLFPQGRWLFYRCACRNFWVLSVLALYD